MSIQLISEVDSIHKALSDIDKRLLIVATELAEALKPSHNKASIEVFHCTQYSPQCSHGFMHCDEVFSKCTSQRKILTINKRGNNE